MSSSIDINGVGTISGVLYEPRVGPWNIKIQVDSADSEVPVEQAILSFFGRLDFGGIVNPKRTVVDNGRANIRLDAGSGLLEDLQETQSFHRSTVGGVLNALAYLTGDAIDPDSEFLEHELQHWTWGKTKGVSILHALAHEAGCSWRTTRAGAILFVAETWPEIDAEIEYQQGPQNPGQTIIFPDDLPLVRPGVTFQGRHVGEVLTTWGPDATLQQTILWEQTEAPTRFPVSIQVDVVDWFESTKGQDLDLSKLYPCKVVAQSADWLTVDLMPDDSVVRGSGLRNVPIAFGVPGLRPRLAIGARCKLGWDAADPKRPFATLFERDGVIEYVVQPDDGSDVTLRTTGGGTINVIADGGAVNVSGDSVNLNGPGNGVACKYDLVSIGLPTAVAPGSPCAPPLPGAPSQFGVILTARTTVTAGGG